ncbi:MAG: hypothetical protein WC069_00930 [Candidatus Shapirobacteria bacterium]
MTSENKGGYEKKETSSDGKSELSLIQRALGLSLDPSAFSRLKIVKSKSPDSEYNHYTQTAYVQIGNEYPRDLAEIDGLVELKDDINPNSIHEVMHAVRNYLIFGDIAKVSSSYDVDDSLLSIALTKRDITQTTLSEFMLNEGFAIYGENLVHKYICDQLEIAEKQINLDTRGLMASRRESVSMEKCISFLDFVDNFIFDHKTASKFFIVGDLARQGVLLARFGSRWLDIAYKCGYLYMDGLSKNGDNIIDILKQDTPTIDEIRNVIIKNASK